MRYWILTTEYPPFFGGGISTYCFHTAGMLSDSGYEVTVFTNDISIPDITINNNKKVRIIRFNPDRTGADKFMGHTTAISYEFASIVKDFVEREGEPDVIESQEYLGIAYYLLQYKYLGYNWCKTIPIIITMHSPSFLYMEYNRVSMYKYPNFWICEMEKFCLQAADHIISPSKYMIDELKKRFALQHEQVTVVPNPYPVVNEQQKATNKPGQLVFFGKLTAQKGVFELLKYFVGLWETGFLRSLYLIGGQDIVYHPEGVSMGAVIRKRYKGYIDKGLLILEDKVKPSAVAKRLEQAELVIIPSNNDNLPYTALEAMALGKIVLVSEQGGQSEVVRNGVNGFTFSHFQEGSFHERLHTILGLPDIERGKISNNAIATIRQKFAPVVIAEQKIQLLEFVRHNKPICRVVFPFIRSLAEKRESHPCPQNKKLSIIIPYYNLGKYIDSTIRSVVESDYPDKEIIIINDGSSDADSLEKINRYRQVKDIRVIDSPSQGLAAARNLGLQNATGAYIAFLDADDKVEPDYYTKAITVLNQYSNVHFVGCWVKYFDESGLIWPAFNPEPPLLLYHNLVNSSALIFKKASIRQPLFNDTGMPFPGMEDYESVVDMFERGCGGVVLPEILFNYRVRSSSMFRELTRAKKLILTQYIANKHKKIYSDFSTDIFGLCSANGTGIVLDNPTLDFHLADKLPFKGKMSLKVIRLIKQNKYLRTFAYKIYKLIKR